MKDLLTNIGAGGGAPAAVAAAGGAPAAGGAAEAPKEEEKKEEEKEESDDDMVRLSRCCSSQRPYVLFAGLRSLRLISLYLCRSALLCSRISSHFGLRRSSYSP